MSAIVYVVSIRKGFLFHWVHGKGCVILLWHPQGLPYNHLLLFCAFISAKSRCPSLSCPLDSLPPGAQANCGWLAPGGKLSRKIWLSSPHPPGVQVIQTGLSCPPTKIKEKKTGKLFLDSLLFLCNIATIKCTLLVIN